MINKDELMNLGTVAFDSPQALIKSKTLFNLQPGQAWAKGYNYTLRKIDGKEIISVIGEDNQGYFTKLHFDLSTGNLILAEHKVSNGGYIYKCENKIALNSNKNIKANFIKVSPNYEKDNTVLVSTVIDPLTKESKNALFMSTDGGKSWVDMRFNHTVKQLYFSKDYEHDNTIYSITKDSVYFTIDKGENWASLFNIPRNTIISSDMRNGNLALLTKDKLYILTKDTKIWNTIDVPSNTWLVRFQPNGTVFICSEKNIYKRINLRWTSTVTPISSKPLGIELFESSLVVYNDTGIWVQNQLTDQWTQVDNTGINIKRICYDPNIKDIYFIGENNRIFYFKERGGSIEVINVKSQVTSENISSVYGVNEDIFYVTDSSQQWELMKN
ncbi:hypothetical protein [Lutispora sp.]|uniref:hypothetical protein n=1 Tax=Lutispora sp. TaxID=2828727 RepID=UPI0035631C5C